LDWKKKRDVTIISIFEALEGITAELVKVVATAMHDTITGHMNFTSMKYGPILLLDAFDCADEVTSSVSYSKLSCTTVMISGDEVCLAHVGECQAIAIDQFGKAIPLTQDHDMSRALGTSNIPEMLHFNVNLFAPVKLPSQSSSLSSSPSSSPTSRRRSSSVVNYFSNFFFPKAKEPDPISKNDFVLAIASSGVWDVLNRDQISQKVQKSLETQNNDVDRAAQDLVEKAWSESGIRPTKSISACMIRWSLE